MAINTSDIKFRKPVTVSDTATNGGRKGGSEVKSGIRHNLFPRVTKNERVNGVTRYRKQFWCNENGDDLTAFGALAFLEYPSNAGDRFYAAPGEQRDTQGTIVANTNLPWVGPGGLAADIAGGVAQFDILMGSDDYVAPNGGILHISNKFRIGQVTASDVVVGDSVVYNGAESRWDKTTISTNIEYPNGILVDDGIVLTVEPTSNEEFLRIAERIRENENVGSGDATQSPALADLSNVVNGLFTYGSRGLVVSAEAASGTLKAYFKADGSLDLSRSDATSGAINPATGAWTTQIVWTEAITPATAILATYYDKAYTFSGNTMTVFLDDPVANPYTTGTTFACPCVELGDIECVLNNLAVSSASGTFTNNIALFNDGTEEEDFTLTYTAATTFSVSGAHLGAIGTGSMGSAFSPINPATGQPYFSIPTSCWGGSWAPGETVTFKTSPSAGPLWLKEVVPPGTAQEPNNLIVLGWYTE